MYDVVIVGAGAAGLAVAAELVETCNPHNLIVLEQGDAAGWSWHNMPRSISLISPWKVNALNRTRVAFRDMHKQHSCNEYAAYLEDYAKRFDIPIRYDAKVVDVQKQAGQLVTVLSNGESVTSRAVVNASGYFFNPFVPDIRGANTTKMALMHVQQFKSAEELSEDIKRVLVVGSRISAGQTVTELALADFDVTVSSRGPIVFARPPWLQKLAFWVYFRIEDLVAKLPQKRQVDTYPGMESGQTKMLIDTGVIKRAGPLRELLPRAVKFLNGTQQEYDLIIFATGFRAMLSHVDELIDIEHLVASPDDVLDDFEHKDVKGLYFLGLDRQRNFRSRYLRGIREDAALLARRIAARLNMEAS